MDGDLRASAVDRGQEACARIGLVTGKGLAGIIRENYFKTVLYVVVFILVIANTINIGADIGAMAEAAKLIVPLPLVVIMLFAVVIILILDIFTSYKVYARYLKWLSLAAVTYLITLFVVKEPWAQIAVSTFVPHIEWNFAFLALIVGNIGTTIAPYLFFWEASQEALSRELKASGI